MTNLSIELILLTLVLINFGAILTSNIHTQSQKKFKLGDYFVVKK